MYKVYTINNELFASNEVLIKIVKEKNNKLSCFGNFNNFKAIDILNLFVPHILIFFMKHLFKNLRNSKSYFRLHFKLF